MKDTKHDHHYRITVDVYVTPPPDAIVTQDMLEDAAQSCVRQRLEVACGHVNDHRQHRAGWAGIWSEIDTVELIQAGECRLCAPDDMPPCGKPIKKGSDTYICTRPPGHAGQCVACGSDVHVIAVQDPQHGKQES